MYQECSISKSFHPGGSAESFQATKASYYAHPEEAYVEPFQIFGNLYYIGDKKVCTHLIDTGDGLIMLDTGYGHTLHLLLASIRKLGFEPKDLRYVIHTHGHFDHFGSTEELRKRYPVRVFMSRVDTQLLRERPDRALIDHGPRPNDPVSWPDTELEDGDCITLGNTTVRCVLAPGHTMGTMAFFFDVTDGEKTYRAGLLGGVGWISVYKAYNRYYGLPENKCQIMGQTIQKLWKEKVDITLGNHPSQNCTISKRQWMLENPGKNPFINPEAWHIFLSTLEECRQALEETGY